MAAIQAGEFKSEISPYEVIARIPDLAGNAVKVKKTLVEIDEGLAAICRRRPNGAGSRSI